MIENIEKFGPELEIQSFREQEFLRE